MTWRRALPTRPAFHVAAPYLAGLAAVALCTMIAVPSNDVMIGVLIISMVLAMILWLLLVMRAWRDVGLLALATLPSVALVVLAGSLIPALFGACVFANRCI